MTEEDTFNKLCKHPFYSIHRLYMEMLSLSIQSCSQDDRYWRPARIQMLKDFGWTYEEYLQEKRKKK